MNNRFIFDALDRIADKKVQGPDTLYRKGDVLEFGGRYYAVEACSYAIERGEATYWLNPGDNHHPTAPDS